MKKNIFPIFLYYTILVAGALVFLGFIIVGRIFYTNEIQWFCDKYPYIAISILIIYFMVYLWALKKSVTTKAFKEWESTKKKKTITKKRMKKVLIIWACVEIIHIGLSIYLIYAMRTGINDVIQYILKYSVVSPILLLVAVYYYKK